MIFSPPIPVLSTTPQIEKDLSKIIFDHENCYADDEDRKQDGTTWSLIGFNTNFSQRVLKRRRVRLYL